VLVFAHPALDSLGLAELGAEAEVVAGEERPVRLAGPSYATLAARLCPRGAPGDGGIAYGTVSDGPRRPPRRGARRGRVGAAHRPRARDFGRPKSRRATTDDRGVYALCGLPADQAVVAAALAGRARTGVLDVLVPASRLLRLDLVVGEPADVSGADARAATDARAADAPAATDGAAPGDAGRPPGAPAPAAVAAPAAAAPPARVPPEPPAAASTPTPPRGRPRGEPRRPPGGGCSRAWRATRPAGGSPGPSCAPRTPGARRGRTRRAASP
jgi:hypothetical protein